MDALDVLGAEAAPRGADPFDAADAADALDGGDPAPPAPGEGVEAGAELVAVAGPADVPVGRGGSGFAPLEVSGGGSGGGLPVCANPARGAATTARAMNAGMKLE